VLLMPGLTVSMSASAQFEALERLVMPGPLTGAHAEYEDQCESCHVRFSRQQQRDLCLDCHEEIAEDLATSTGFHSLAPQVGEAICASCHTDHEGRDADILGLDRNGFDHDLTDFPLRDSHSEAVCDDCHSPNDTFRAAATTCVACHADDDQHMGNLGEVCSDCHAATEWSDARYDHELESGYALLGAHAMLTCVGCHVGEQYEGTLSQCVDCHRDDDTHTGLNGSECQDCHGSTDWADTSFDHFARTDFALAGAHSGLACESCHAGSVFEQTRTTECVSCHLDDDAHAGISGSVCNDCHQVSEWLEVTFDHALDADFALLGSHAGLECNDCHVEPVADALPASQCIGCHADDEPHAGQLGENCSSCHAEVDWAASVRFDHGLTGFPLLGRHSDVLCEDCHATLAFHDASEQCVDCHADDDTHETALGLACASCHMPLDWALWRFDHAAQTDFPLSGAHDGLTCAACHRTPAVEAVIAVGRACIDCHRGDDIHRGEFGDACDSCHEPDSFSSLRALQ